jgi:hypothetical protein
MDSILLKSPVLAAAIVVPIAVSVLLIPSLRATPAEAPKKPAAAVEVQNLTAVEFDGCEYIQYTATHGLRHITHKGNCKYCLQRAVTLHHSPR